MAVPNIFGSATAAIPLSQLDQNFATAITLGNTAVYLGNTTTSLGNVTLTNVTVSSGNVTITGANVSGNLAFTGTGNRITGDFSNATVANRVAFQSSTTNGQTGVIAIPNGTSTAVQFEANSDSSGGTNASIASMAITATDARFSSGLRGTGTYLPMTFYTGGSERVRVDTSGNVGIGTSSPTGKFQVKATNPQIWMEDSAGGTNGKLTAIGTSNGTMTFNRYLDNGSLVGEFMRIDSGGNLLVGTTSTTGRIGSKATTTDSNGYGIYVEDSAAALMFYARNDGAISTGAKAASPYNNTTASAANLFVNSNGVLLRSTSSLKYKTNVQDATHGLAEVLTLRPVTYEGKAESDAGKTFGGLIAEEVHEAGLTEFVQYAEDGSPDALAYGNMVSLCVKAIQEQQAIITQLQADVAALKGTA